MKTFQELVLPQSIHAALKEMNFTVPTPIQAQAIPVVLTGQDLIGCAQTGTGKTAAYSIPIITTLLKNMDETALILAPTRELAIQITEVIENLTMFCKHMRVVNLIGGMSMQHQLRNVQKGYRIIVATPGRLLDHCERNPRMLSKVSMFVLDEADRMLDMGFAPQLRRIFPLLPKQRQTLLFSATLPPEIQKMAEKILIKPKKVQVGDASIPADKISQQARVIQNGEQKNDLLLNELNQREGSVLVFVRTQHRADRVSRNLEGFGIKVTRIHGGRSQGQRVKALGDFKDGRVRVLVATDIAARGIDISHVAHVINYDLPQVPEDYIHRIGRTARAGRAGDAMSFISSDDVEQWRNIEKLLFKKGIASSLKMVGGSISSKSSNSAPAKAKAKPVKNGYPKQVPVAMPKFQEKKGLFQASPALAARKIEDPTDKLAIVSGTGKVFHRQKVPANIRFKNEEGSRGGRRNFR
jgi:superfamily II DNA/RNA helicase